MNKFNITPEFAEELGAYLEGNLSMEDTRLLEQFLQANDDISAFIDTLSIFDDCKLNNQLEDILNIELDFVLPEKSMNIECFIPNDPFLLEYNPTFMDIEVTNNTLDSEIDNNIHCDDHIFDATNINESLDDSNNVLTINEDECRIVNDDTIFFT